MDHSYLQSTVGPVLVDVLARVAQVRPTDPIAYIGRFLAAKCDEKDVREAEAVAIAAAQDLERRAESDALAKAEQDAAARALVEAEAKAKAPVEVQVQDGVEASNEDAPTSVMAALGVYETLSTAFPSSISSFATCISPVQATAVTADDGGPAPPLPTESVESAFGLAERLWLLLCSCKMFE